MLLGKTKQGVVHKLCLQDEVGRWSKNVHFLSNFFVIENVNVRGVGGQKNQNLVIVVCERPPTAIEPNLVNPPYYYTSPPPYVKKTAQST